MIIKNFETLEEIDKKVDPKEQLEQVVDKNFDLEKQPKEMSIRNGDLEKELKEVRDQRDLLSSTAGTIYQSTDWVVKQGIFLTRRHINRITKRTVTSTAFVIHICFLVWERMVIKDPKRPESKNL